MTFFGSGTFGRVSFFVLIAIALSACSTDQTRNPSETAAVASNTQLRFSDETMAKKKIQTALENLSSGKTAYWQNPESGASGSVTPLKTWKTNEGVYCRSFQTSIRLASGRSTNRKGVACRSDAVWKAVAAA